MHPAAMHEHVGYELIDVEVGRLEEVQTEYTGKVYSHRSNQLSDEEHHDVDDEKILCNYGDISHYRKSLYLVIPQSKANAVPKQLSQRSVRRKPTGIRLPCKITKKSFDKG